MQFAAHERQAYISARGSAAAPALASIVHSSSNDIVPVAGPTAAAAAVASIHLLVRPIIVQHLQSLLLLAGKPLCAMQMHAAPTAACRKAFMLSAINNRQSAEGAASRSWDEAADLAGFGNMHVHVEDSLKLPKATQDVLSEELKVCCRPSSWLHT